MMHHSTKSPFGTIAPGGKSRTAARVDRVFACRYSRQEGADRVTCSGCGVDNRAGAQFCRECGARLSIVCHACGAAMEPGMKFCDGCGAPVAGAPTSHPPRGPVHAESVLPAASDVAFPAPEAYTPRHLADRITRSKASLEGE